MRDLLHILWDSLLELDDLSASTASIMELLCILLSCGATAGHSSTTGPSGMTSHSGITGPSDSDVDCITSATSTDTHQEAMITQPPENSTVQLQTSPLQPLSMQATGSGSYETQTATPPGVSVQASQSGAVMMQGPSLGVSAGITQSHTTDIHPQLPAHGSGCDSSSHSAAVNTIAAQMQPLDTLVPRLWPFLSHTIASVRFSCLKVLQTLLHMTRSATAAAAEDEPMLTNAGPKPTSSGPASLEWLRLILQSTLCQVFQRFALEGDEGNRELVHQVWNQDVIAMGIKLVQTCRPCIDMVLCL